ncbi:hypothetical protein WICPIJ_005821 [Wickerhamomyces pijperi]|uniref:Uncharacterized protein n=1 Tax=Wickerhamomyces pijperi TaxID=599730 RepID=A0A9P8TKR6_WICPI|nr:hypothetical protein WICPIJ_005821 [Wickerhamomyces pijperi]
MCHLNDGSETSNQTGNHQVNGGFTDNKVGPSIVLSSGTGTGGGSRTGRRSRRSRFISDVGSIWDTSLTVSLRICLGVIYRSVGSITAKESRLGGQVVGEESVGVWDVRERGIGVDDTELALVSGNNRSTVRQIVVSVGRVIEGEDHVDVSFWLDEWGNWNVLQIFTTVN